MRKPRSSFKLQDVQRAVNSQKFLATAHFPVSASGVGITSELRHTLDAVGALS